MPVSVNFEKPPGKLVTTRSFELGDKIRVSGKVTGPLGLGEPGSTVRVEISDGFGSLYGIDMTSILGNYGVDLTLPSIVTDATVTVTASYSGLGQDRAVVPISIGREATGTVPVPFNWSGIIILLVILAIIGVIVFMLYRSGTLQAVTALGKARA